MIEPLVYTGENIEEIKSFTNNKIFVDFYTNNIWIQTDNGCILAQVFDIISKKENKLTIIKGNMK